MSRIKFSVITGDSAWCYLPSREICSCRESRKDPDFVRDWGNSQLGSSFFRVHLFLVYPSLKDLAVGVPHQKPRVLTGALPLGETQKCKWYSWSSWSGQNSACLLHLSAPALLCELTLASRVEAAPDVGLTSLGFHCFLILALKTLHAWGALGSLRTRFCYILAGFPNCSW